MEKLSFEDAKIIYKKWDCSTFTMARENLPLYEKYLKLNIPKELEKEWRKERFCEILNINNQYPAWKTINKLYELARSIGMIEFYKEIGKKIELIKNNLEDRERVIITETIIGRLEISERSGLIFESFDLGDKELSKYFSDMVLFLINFKTNDDNLVVRISNAKKTNSDIVRVLGL